MTKKQKLVIQILALVLVLVLAIRPVAVKLAERLATRRQLEKRLTQLKTKLDILEGVDQALIDSRVKSMEAVFPSDKPIVVLMASLSQLAAENNLSFGGISLSPGSLTGSADGLADLRFGFQVGGDFLSIAKFMQALENSSPLMKIEEVGLSIKTNPLFEAGLTVVAADIKVSAFYQPPPKSLGALEKPVNLLSRNDEALLNQLVGFRTFTPILPLTEVGKTNLFE